MANDNIHFYIPAEIQKAVDSNGQEVMKFKGIASTSQEDSQEEYLDPSGFDLSSFRFVNWNHLGSKNSAAIIGEPTLAKITKGNELYVEGVLFPEVDMAKATWALMKALQNSPSGNKLGISVEGKALARDPNNPKKITKARITSIALCEVPINGGTWADILKGEMPEDEEEINEDTQKAMTAAEGDNVTSKESVENTPKNLCLKKSDVFEQIQNRFPTIDVEKAKSVYQLIEKISTMETNENKISEETISKAFEILNLATTDISKGEKTEPKKEDEEDADEKEMTGKASEKCKMMKSEGKTDDEIKATLIKKGFGETIISKAFKSLEEVVIEKSEKPVISKKEVLELVKAELGTLNQKFDAVNTILKAQIVEKDELKKSLDAVVLENAGLKTKIETIEKTPIGHKSILSKSYTDRSFGNGATQGETKNEGQKFNMYNPADRHALKTVLLDKSIVKGELVDESLANMAQHIEIAGNLEKSEDVQILLAKGIEVVYEK